MTPVSLSLLAAALTTIVGWAIHAARHRIALASLQTQVAALQQQLAERLNEWTALKADHQRTQESLRAEGERRAAAEEKAARVPSLEQRIQDQGQLLSQHSAKQAELETQIVAERKAAEEKLLLLDHAQTKLSDAFKALSSDALASNNKSFIDLARATLATFHENAKGDLKARELAVDELVRPMRATLEKVDCKLGEIEKERVSAYSALNEQLRTLVETHLPMLRGETLNLVKALRQPTVRGRWGEIQLKRVVEMAGMLNHCDFFEQQSCDTDEGRLRPDLIVRLPGGKRIVVDSKAPVEAYLHATEAHDEDQHRFHLADHARQVRAHMSALGRKGYWEQFEPAPEFVVLFLPGEMFFSAALQQDPDLIEFGVNERVIPATPTTLIALLRAVAYGWRQEALARNAQEVAELGKQLYERVGKLAEYWSDVGNRLGKAVDAYNKSVNALESRVLVSVRRFRDLEAAPSDAEIEAPEPVDQMVRALQAPEMALRAIAGDGPLESTCISD